MRTGIVAAAVLGLVIALSPQLARAEMDLRIALSVVGGTARAGVGPCRGDMHCVVALPDDTLVIRIDADVGPGVALSIASQSFAYDPDAAILDEFASTEEASAEVYGELLTPIGVPGIDIREEEPGFAAGWEMQTLRRGGVSGPAKIMVGTAAFTLTGLPTTFDVAAGVGVPGGTLVGDGEFYDVSDEVAYDVIRVVPEPGAAAVAGAALATLAALARRRRAVGCR